MFHFIKQQPITEFQIELPGATIIFSHKLKICFIYEMDSAMPDGRYTELEKHLNAKGYFMQVIVAPPGMPIPVASAYPSFEMSNNANG